MRFYNQAHQYYAGIDLHARTLYACVLDSDGDIRLHRKAPTTREAFLRLIGPYRDDLVVACECLFCWYWLADLCTKEGLDFVLGHAYYMKAIHGGKTKNDRIDSQKIALLLRGGMLPMAYVYPRKMRPTRDLLRRRLHFVRKRAELLSHIQNTNTQYNLPAIGGRIDKESYRGELLEHFGDDPEVQMSIAADVAMLDTYETTIHDLELYIEHCIRADDTSAFYLLRSIPGIGKILAFTIFYEIHDIARFPKVGNFLSYARLVPGSRESDGKMKAAGGRKMGNAHLKWAFSEAAALFLRGQPDHQKLFRRLEKKHGRKKALGVLAAKLGRAVYFMLKRRQPFDRERFLKV